MTEPGGAPRVRVLAGALRDARTKAKLSVREVARSLDVSHSVVSYWETAKRTPRLEDVASYLTVIGLVGEDREAILDLARHVDDRDWLTVGIPGITQQLAGAMECERSASVITHWSPNIVTGLLQTSDYARTIIRSSANGPSNDIETQVLIRMGRRDVISRSDPVQLTALMGEAALHDPIGGETVLAHQLRHLLKTANETSVDIRVVRSGLGWHPGLCGPFVIYDFDGAPSIVLLEHYRTGAFVYEADDVKRYVHAADEIGRLALSVEDSLGLIESKLRELESRG